MPAQPSCTLVDATVALPRTRVPGRTTAVATGQPDEDVVTLGAQAALQLLDRCDGVRPAALLLASVSAPYAEGGTAQVLAEVLDLAADELLVLELTGSTAAGAGAIVTAAALIAGGTSPVLVVTADVRRDPSGRALGDAAVALLLGLPDGEGAAILQPLASTAELVRDEWRRADAAATERADSSFARVAAPPPRPRPGVEQRVTATPAGPPVPRVGMAGCAALPLALLLALDGGDGDAVASASGVSHRIAFTAGPDAGRVAAAAREAVGRGVEAPAPSWPAAGGFDPYASQPRAWRDRATELRLAAQRDETSGEVLFPPVPAPAADGLVPIRLARTGEVLTHTRDHIFPQAAPLSMAVVQLDGGGRFYGQVVDGLPVAIGDRVTLVLRRLHDGGGAPQWFWKVRPDAADDRLPVDDPVHATTA